MKSLVTGGGGFLGQAIVKMLLERGDEVIALGRNRYSALEELGATSFVADVSKPETFADIFSGVDEVYHTAAIADIWGRPQDFISINYKGTLNVIAACHANNIKKLIYTSSPSVVFAGKSQRNVNESQAYPKTWLADYPKTKAMAEQAVLQSNGQRGLYSVALRPHLIWGPGDRHLIPRLLKRAQKGQLMQVGDGQNKVDIIYIDNAAEAHLLASKQLGPNGNSNGKAYFLSQNAPVNLWDFIGEILSRAKAPAVKKSLSFKKAYNIGFLMEKAYKLIGKTEEPRMTRFLACQLATDHYYDISRSISDFNYVARISTKKGLDIMFPGELM